MAHLILRVDGHEVARPRLDRSVVIGRSAACDISIRDSLLSRRHCKIEFRGGNWIVTDLQSRNGTWCQNQRLHSRPLADGDQVRIGIVQMIFVAMTSDAARYPVNGRSRKNRRLVEPARRLVLPRDCQKAGPFVRPDGSPRPMPRPRPRDPASYSRENLYELFARISANSPEGQFHLPSRSRLHAGPSPRPRSRKNVLQKNLGQTQTERLELDCSRPMRLPLRTASVFAHLTLIVSILLALGCGRVK